MARNTVLSPIRVAWVWVVVAEMGLFLRIGAEY
jgi:hypothetical protein